VTAPGSLAGVAAAAPGYRVGVDDADSVRIGTAEREAAVAALAEHLAAGRLDAGEYENRMTRAAAARSRADLRPLFADLPGSPVVTGPRPGTLPGDLRARLAAEGLLFLAENVAGTMAHRRYQVPGRRVFRRTEDVHGALAVTRERLVVWAAGAKRVDVPFADPRWEAVDVSVGRAGRLRVAVSVGAFHPDGSGRLGFSFVTPDAGEVLRLVRAAR
jgi:hypothetical protein